MGNLLSMKFGAPPPRASIHKRKQRGLSITSTSTGISTITQKVPVSRSYDGQTLFQSTASPDFPLNSLQSKVRCVDQKHALTIGQCDDQKPMVKATGHFDLTIAVVRKLHHDAQHFRHTSPACNGQSVTTGQATKARRSSLKMTLKRAYSSTSSNVFTEERRQLVQITWREITDRRGKLKSAMLIFRTLFDQCPDLKGVFNVHSMEENDLETCPHFVRHTRVFSSVLDLAVRNVFELETEVGPVLIMFGRRHFYKHQLAFRNEYLILFAQSISDFITSHFSESFAANPEANVAWRLFINYIIHKVKEGYDLECIAARKHSAILY